jgi:hypothetical protein
MKTGSGIRDRVRAPVGITSDVLYSSAFLVTYRILSHSAS